MRGAHASCGGSRGRGRHAGSGGAGRLEPSRAALRRARNDCAMVLTRAPSCVAQRRGPRCVSQACSAPTCPLASTGVPHAALARYRLDTMASGNGFEVRRRVFMAADASSADAHVFTGQEAAAFDAARHAHAATECHRLHALLEALGDATNALGAANWRMRSLGADSDAELPEMRCRLSASPLPSRGRRRGRR